MSVVLIGGGVRCGKSAFALRYAKQLGQRRMFIATAQALDEEMKARVDAHARERGDDFTTVEAPFELSQALRELRYCDVVVIDCLTLWLSNLLLQGLTRDSIEAKVAELVTTLRAVPFHVLIVTNEVGMGVVPETPLGRAFRDLCGRAHQQMARCADEIFFAVLGMLLRIKPEPLRIEVGG